MVVEGERRRLYRPGEVADRLGIQPQTLRVWSNEFAEVLSPAATKAVADGGKPGQRRYDEVDLQRLLRARELLDRYRSFAYALRHLRDEIQQQPTLPSQAPSPDRAVGAADLEAELAELRHALARGDATIAERDAAIAARDREMRDKDRVIAALGEEVARLGAALQTTGAARDRATDAAVRFRRLLADEQRRCAGLELRLRPWWRRLGWPPPAAAGMGTAPRPWWVWWATALALLSLAAPAWVLLAAPVNPTWGFVLVAATSGSALLAVLRQPVVSPRWLDLATTGAAVLGAGAGAACLASLVGRCGWALVLGDCRL